MTKSKSKTFPKGTDFVDVLNWIDEQVECDIKAVAFGGSEPSSDYIDSTKEKYIITVTKVLTEKNHEHSN